jgi:acyl carrier protein
MDRIPGREFRLTNRETLRTLVADALQLPLEAVPEDASSETLEAWDSLRHLDVIMAVESATHLSFPTAEIVEMTSLEKIEAALASRGWKP